MMKQETGELCCKVVSIYILVAGVGTCEGALLSLVAFQTTAYEGVGTFARIVVFFPSLLLFCFSACFWLYADDISRRMLPEKEGSSDIPSGVSTDHEALKHTAFVIAGVLILIGAIPALAQPIASILAPPRQLTIYARVYLAEAIIRIVLGTWLIVGTEKLRTLAGQLRNLAKKDW